MVRATKKVTKYEVVEYKTPISGDGNKETNTHGVFSTEEEAINKVLEEREYYDKSIIAWPPGFERYAFYIRELVEEVVDTRYKLIAYPTGKNTAHPPGLRFELGYRYDSIDEVEDDRKQKQKNTDMWVYVIEEVRE